MENLELSNIELYYSNLCELKSKLITIDGEEKKHILNVMRHQINDEIYVTNGMGKIFKCRIQLINKNNIETIILSEFTYKKRFPNITFCIPILRNADRFEFAIEKCTELGVAKFTFYHAQRSVHKKVSQSRIDKILIAAMKQSLLSWLPEWEYAKSLNEIELIKEEKIVFEQKSEVFFNRELLNPDKNYLLIFGPEGDFTNDELNELKSSVKYKIAENRLRTETAIIKAASLL